MKGESFEEKEEPKTQKERKFIPPPSTTSNKALVAR